MDETQEYGDFPLRRYLGLGFGSDDGPGRAQVHGDDGRLVATASGTFTVIEIPS